MIAGRGFLLWHVVVLLIVVVSGCGGGGSSNTPPPITSTPGLALASFVSGLRNPLDFQVPDDGSGRIFIVQQPGTIRLVASSALLSNSLFGHPRQSEL